MKLRIALAVAGLIVASAFSTHAQEGAPPSPAEPVEGSPTAAPTAAEPGHESAVVAKSEPPPSPASTAPPGAGVACVTDNFGLDLASARTAGRLVCDEIRGRGVKLNAEGVPGAESYRISFERLGRQLIARLSYESPTGNVIRSRRLVLSSPEEITVAAPRLAAAVVFDRKLDEGQRVDNLVGEETRKYKKKSGEFLWGVGIAGISGPTAGVAVLPGIELLGYYETPRVGFGFSARIAVGDGGGPNFSYGAFALGGRYFLSETDTAAFVGGGLSISRIEASDDDFHGEGSGLGAFAEVGAEFLRLHSSRMILSARVEAPFYGVDDQWNYDDNGNEVKGDSQYHLPISVALAYAW